MKNFNSRSNCYFTHSIIADLVFVLMQVFNKKNCASIENIYSEIYIESVREEHRFLAEVIASLPSHGYEMLEFLLLNDNFNNIEEYKRFILSIEDDKFFYDFYGKYIDNELLKLALQDDKGLNKLYSSYDSISTSFIALKSLFNNKSLFVDEFFSCLERLYTKDFANIYEQITTRVYDEFDRIENSLLELEPLELSQRIMGKTFKNRGPYKNFTFVPSHFVTGKAVRFFGKDQILIYSINHNQFTRDDITKILKIISDDKRFEIIELLSENKPLMGKELAERLDLSKATISHHIEQLKGTGFINEERIKNSKFYSINSVAIDKFMNYLSSKLRNS